jgi:hypothetical protein
MLRHAEQYTPRCRGLRRYALQAGSHKRARILLNRKEVKTMAKGSKSGGHYRSAKSGRYVTPKYGKSHPSTTVKESK